MRIGTIYPIGGDPEYVDGMICYRVQPTEDGSVTVRVCFTNEFWIRRFGRSIEASIGRVERRRTAWADMEEIVAEKISQRAPRDRRMIMIDLADF